MFSREVQLSRPEDYKDFLSPSGSLLPTSLSLTTHPSTAFFVISYGWRLEGATNMVVARCLARQTKQPNRGLAAVAPTTVNVRMYSSRNICSILVEKPSCSITRPMVFRAQFWRVPLRTHFVQAGKCRLCFWAQSLCRISCTAVAQVNDILGDRTCLRPVEVFC